MQAQRTLTSDGEETLVIIEDDDQITAPCPPISDRFLKGSRLNAQPHLDRDDAVLIGAGDVVERPRAYHLILTAYEQSFATYSIAKGGIQYDHIPRQHLDEDLEHDTSVRVHHDPFDLRSDDTGGGE